MDNTGTQKTAQAKPDAVKTSLYKVSSNPHVRAADTTSKIMQYVVIALLPATVFGIFNFGIRTLFVILFTVASAVLTEYIYERCMGMKITIGDFSAVVTGLLLALNLPPGVPLWIGVIGGIFAILVVKMLFGGLGQNFMNPALGARCFLMISFTSIMTGFDCDTYTGATPLAMIKNGDAGIEMFASDANTVGLLDMMTGRTSGTIGETSALLLLAGAAFLLWKKVIDLKIPGTYLLTFTLFILLFSGRGFDLYYILSQLFGGGLILGAFFMATDYVTRPVTKNGQYLFGAFLGIMTGIFRLFGPSAEGVSYAIIIGNLLVPLMEMITKPKPFGKGGEAR